MKIAMYGGTFNPIHLGHMNAAKAVVEGLQLDKLLLMPANVPPHKALPEGSASPAQRLEMCRMAASQLDRVEACPLELERTGPSYTVDTLAELHNRYPGAQFWLVVGTDMVLSLTAGGSPKRWQSCAVWRWLPGMMTIGSASPKRPNSCVCSWEWALISWTTLPCP